MSMACDRCKNKKCELNNCLCWLCKRDMCRGCPIFKAYHASNAPLRSFLGVLVGVGLLLYTFNNAMAEDVKMYKIIQIESNGNPRAYNKSSGARGLCQITQICLNEWNNYKAGAWGLLLPVDLWNPDINLAVATWYINERIPQMLKFYDIKDTIENRLRAYNSGIGTLVKGRYPQETRDYVRKYFNQ